MGNPHAGPWTKDEIARLDGMLLAGEPIGPHVVPLFPGRTRNGISHQAFKRRNAFAKHITPYQAMVRANFAPDIAAEYERRAAA